METDKALEHKLNIGSVITTPELFGCKNCFGKIRKNIAPIPASSNPLSNKISSFQYRRIPDFS